MTAPKAKASAFVGTSGVFEALEMVPSQMFDVWIARFTFHFKGTPWDVSYPVGRLSELTEAQAREIIKDRGLWASARGEFLKSVPLATSN